MWTLWLSALHSRYWPRLGGGGKSCTNMRWHFTEKYAIQFIQHHIAMRRFHKQRGAAVPLVLCLKLKNIKSTAGMFLNTQHNSWWRNNEVTVLVDEPGPLWVYNQQFQVLTLVQRSRRAARNHRVFDFVLDCIYKILENDVDFVGRTGFPEQTRSVGHSPTPQGSQQDERGPFGGVWKEGRQGKLALHCLWRHHSGFTGSSLD